MFWKMLSLAFAIAMAALAWCFLFGWIDPPDTKWIAAAAFFGWAGSISANVRIDLRTVSYPRR